MLFFSPAIPASGEASGVVLMGDRLTQVVDSIELGRATLSKIRQNLAWALCYNIVGIPLAAGEVIQSSMSRLSKTYSTKILIL